MIVSIRLVLLHLGVGSKALRRMWFELSLEFVADETGSREQESQFQKDQEGKARINFFV